jgi:putative CocE/NonD family hydrolase
MNHRMVACLSIGLLLWSGFTQAASLPRSKLERAARDVGALEDRYAVDELIMVPMRDGVRLSTAVIRPKNEARHPVVLIRTPYDFPGELSKSIFRAFFANGYAVVMQNERGTHWSEGSFHFLGRAREDGYDTLSWIAAQPWSNGNVGTYGCSSAAENQLGLATLRHPAHRAMIAISAGAGIGSIPGVSSQGLFYKNGVPMFVAWAEWYATYGHSVRPVMPTNLSDEDRRRLALTYDPEANRRSGAELDAAFRDSIAQLPSRDALRRLGLPPMDFDTYITRTPADPQWQALGLVSAGDTNAIPALHVNSWGDMAPYETMKLFEFQQTHPGQHLIMAGTAHCDIMKATEATMTGDREVGDARLPYEQIFVQWFDQHLKMDRRSSPQPKVRSYLLGSNRWLVADQWPLPGGRKQHLYLESGGNANSRYGDGRLSEAPAKAEQSADRFVSDPAAPVPSVGGSCCTRSIFRDQSVVESRRDVLVYSTPPLQKGGAVIGDIDAILYVTATSPDADIALKLVDVYPDGRAFNVSDTIFRLRYRDGFDKPAALVPGQVYKVQIRGLSTSNYFAPGHRLRLEVAGSNFPNHERNLQTGGNNYDESQPQVATISVLHDREHPSHLTFTVYDDREIQNLQERRQ